MEKEAQLEELGGDQSQSGEAPPSSKRGTTARRALDKSRSVGVIERKEF